MNTTIQITYICKGQKVYQSGSFPLKGQTPKQVAEQWIKEINRKMEVEEILKIVIDGVISTIEKG